MAMVRNWILRIHLIGGALCFWYLIIFGISSLHFHHHFGFMENLTREETRQTTFSNKGLESDSALAVALQKHIGAAGWHLPWETYTDSAGRFHTQIENPSTSYFVTYDPSASNLKVRKVPKGFWSVVNSLHAFGEMPGAPWMLLWKYYTYVCLLVVLFSVFSGIWLWLKAPGRKAIAAYILTGALLLSVGIITAIFLE